MSAWVLSQAAVTLGWLFADILGSRAYDQMLNLLQQYRLGTQAFLSDMPHYRRIRETNRPAAH